MRSSRRSTLLRSRPIGLRTAVVAAVAVALAASSLFAVAPASAADAPIAGGHSAGDSLFPNQGNTGYDALHYDIDFAVDVAVSPTANAVASTTLSRATATIDATTTGAPLSSYSFDFQGSSGDLAASTLTVGSVTVNGVAASFSRIESTSTSDATVDKHKLIVTPATPVDGAFTTVVTYSGKPVAHTDTDGSSEGWNNTTDGATFLNQPVGAMTLFPNNDTPRDTATYRFTVDAPTMLSTSNYASAGGKPYQAGVVSNGELTSRTASADGTRTTWVWDETKPMASELSFVSIGRYDIYSSTITLASGRSIPEWTFIDPAISVANQTATLGTRAQLKSILDFFESKYGPYPGNSTGLVTDVVPSAINYALETQDRPFFPNSAGRGTTYHELMHQWFGDQVTPTDWNDITLNEGPATYSETQFPYEGAGSTTTPTETSVFTSWNSSSASSSLWAVPAAKMTLASQLFGTPTYTRGNMGLVALRTSIGADAFERLMRRWQTQYGGVQTDQRRMALFEQLAEQISGRDLTAFFDTWFFTTGKPAWPVKFTLTTAGPGAQVNPGDTIAYTLSVRNTGKVAMPAGGTVVTFDAADILDNATAGDLPGGVTLDGTTLSWAVPATALSATSSVALPFVIRGDAAGATLAGTARAATLGSTCLDCAQSQIVGAAAVSPSPNPGIVGPAVVGSTLTADTTGWADGTSFAYQWLVDGTPVTGATASTYAPDVYAVGLAITVEVTGTRPGFIPTSRTSAATAAVVRATMTTSVPTISGTPQVGKPLAVSPGAWTPGTVFTYQWRANGTNISGATGPVYTPAVATQAGQALDVVVTGTKAGFTTSAVTSAATSAVAAADPLANTPTPVLPVTAPVVGVPFAPRYGSWDDGTTLTFTWQGNGTNIAGATAGSFTPTSAQLGQTLTVTVVGSKPGYTAVTRTSSVSLPVEPGTQTRQPTPTITGTPRAGSASTGIPGAWDTGTTLTYQWAANGTAIEGATATTYTPTADQIGAALTFSVTSTRAGYTTVTTTSAASTVLGYAQTLTPTPVISGTPVVGGALTLDPGTWDDGTQLRAQWYADGTPIDGAYGTQLTLDADQLAAVITVSVTSEKPQYETTSRTSAPTDAVAAGALTLTPTPALSGTPKVGSELAAVPGTWDSGVTLSYQWLDDGEPIADATAATFTPGAGLAGEALAVAVTGTKPGYATTTRTSPASAAVLPGDLSLTPVPTVSGTPKVGVELTAVPGTWDDGVALSYQWLDGVEPIEGATDAAFTPGADLVGHILAVAVTGTTAGYTSVTESSAGTSAVALGTQTLHPQPTVTGTLAVGQMLTLHPGTWDDGVTLSYQWSADGVAIEGATGTTLTLTADELGATISVLVTGSAPGYQDLTLGVEFTTAVAPGALSATPTPTFTGSVKTGQVLTAVTGAWDDGVTFTYQWKRGGQPIAGATSSAYRLTQDDYGHTITVAVTGWKVGYTAVTSGSSSAVVHSGAQVHQPKAQIKGVVAVGHTLSVVPAAFDSGVTRTYSWYANGKRVAGGSTLALTSSLKGKHIQVKVVAKKRGYLTLTSTSAATAAVK